jgi:hypothetical protein
MLPVVLTSERGGQVRLICRTRREEDASVFDDRKAIRLSRRHSDAGALRRPGLRKNLQEGDLLPARALPGL